MRRPLLVLLPLLLLACKSEDSSATETKTDETCNTQSLVLFGELYADVPAKRLPEVWDRFKGDCGRVLPKPTQDYFDHALAPNKPSSLDAKALAELIEQVCPGSSEIEKVLADTGEDQRATAVHQGCKLDRFEVFDTPERQRAATSVPLTPEGGVPVVAFVIHQWLLDQGLDSAQARPITRLLYAIEVRSRSPIQPELQQTWPTAQGVPFEPGVLISVGMGEVRIGGEVVAKLDDDGELEQADLERLKAQLETEKRDDKRLIISAHDATPAKTIASLIDTAWSAGFMRFSFVVESSTSGYYGQIPTVSPILDIPIPGEPPMTAPMMSIEITADGYSMSRGGDHEGEPTKAEQGDQAALLTYAQALKQEDPKSAILAISVGPGVSYQQLVSAIEAVRGPACWTSKDDCVLPDVFVLPSPAHEYSLSRLRKPPYGGMLVTNPDAPKDYGVGGLGLIGKGGGGSDGTAKAQVEVAKSTVQGQLAAGDIERVAKAHIEEVRACTTSAPLMGGTIDINIVITGTGRVGAAVVQSTTVPSKPTANCFAKAVKRWTFPKPKDGGNVLVTIPFELSPAK